MYSKVLSRSTQKIIFLEYVAMCSIQIGQELVQSNVEIKFQTKTL